MKLPASAILVDNEVVPCPDVLEWGKWMGSHERHVGDTHIGPFRISTVFLGLNHGYGSTDLWFETMVFIDRGEPFEPFKDVLFCQQYCTYAEAERGHENIVEKVKSGQIGE